MLILATGGAGYIGSHVVKQLSEAGHEVIVFDNLSTGYREALLYNEKLIVADLADEAALAAVFTQYPIQMVMHFAASVSVPESVAKPLWYYHNNTVNTCNLLRSCVKYGVKKIIFSSTAAVYGAPESGVAAEDTPTLPIHPYGTSKLMSEWMLRDAAQVGALQYVVLRYFNAAGSDPLTRIGQSTPQASHLIKVCCLAALGLQPQVKIYGTDYPTPDGTGVRDYIHVEDIASAHVAAANYLQNNSASLTLNVGYGLGNSVREVIQTVQRVSGVNFPVVEVARRPGDPAMLIAKAEAIREKLAWQPQHASLEKIVTDAWRWECKLSQE